MQFPPQPLLFLIGNLNDFLLQLLRAFKCLDVHPVRLALVGHAAYDLVSLLQDARRDVDEGLERTMLEYYIAASRADASFAEDYARLGAQRNAKIVGIFVRLWQRDGKPRYLDYIPRVWALLERDLAHPALAPVARWFDANVPAALRDPAGRLGGTFAA